MDQALLVNQGIDAGEKLVREFQKFIPVRAAFWLKASDEPHAYLYIASDRVRDTNLKVAYGEVLRLADRLQSPFLDPFRVKLVNSDDPLAKAAIEINRRFPGKSMHIGGEQFGGFSADDVYVYALP
jgi:hypothetical protein